MVFLWLFMPNEVNYVLITMKIISVLNLLSIIFMIFFEKRNPTKVLKWMGILMFLPLFGFVCYFFFGRGAAIGRRKKILSKIEKDNKYREFLKLQSDIISQGDESSPMVNLINYNLNENSSIYTTNNNVKIFTNISEQYKEMFEDIKNATKFINVFYFIIKKDESGKQLRDLLIEKAKSGVRVRLCYDDIGCIRTPRRFFKSLKKAGATVHAFFPSFFRGLNRNINYRNHRKIVVIDGDIGYVGGANIGNEYKGLKNKVYPWRDTHLKITGFAVQSLNLRFMQDFNFSNKVEEDIDIIADESKLSINGNVPVQIVSSGPDSIAAGIETAYIKAIFSARKRVYLQTPYFVPDEIFINALISAARSGVDVRLMIPGKPDKKFVYYATLAYATELIEAGVKVYAYNGFLHAKTLLVDDNISSVGTFNLDNRSFVLHFEVTAFMYGEEIGHKMQDIFENDVKNSMLMDSSYLKNRSIFQRFMERVMILFSPLM